MAAAGLARGMGRWYRPTMLGLALVILAGALFVFRETYGTFDRVGYVGIDIAHYLDATRRWLATGTPYPAAEVAAPFAYGPQTFLHPPVALWLFLPFTVLPSALWWAIPLGVVGWCLWRPAPWTWPLLAAVLAYPRFQGALVVGNTDLWVAAAVTAGARFGWPALLVVIKPSLAFLALVGVRKRAFWLGVPVVAVLCLPFGTLWLDWIAVVRHSPGDITYSLPNVPWLLALVFAGLARADGGAESPS